MQAAVENVPAKGFVKHLDHLNMGVANLAETERWYADVFGFSRVEGGMQGGKPWAILRAGDAYLCVYEVDLPFVDRRERPVQGVNHFALRITDREAWQGKIDEHGLKLLYGGVIRWPTSTSWYVADPTGYEIEVALWEADLRG